MKTVISINDNLLDEADQIARQMGVSRSRLFSLAVQDYLSRPHNDEMLDQLNRVYGKHPDSSERRAVKGIKSKIRSTIKEQW